MENILKIYFSFWHNYLIQKLFFLTFPNAECGKFGVNTFVLCFVDLAYICAYFLKNLVKNLFY